MSDSEWISSGGPEFGVNAIQVARAFLGSNPTANHAGRLQETSHLTLEEVFKLYAN